MAAGLGTKLRRLLALLDGDVQQVYDKMELDFRPRFYPIVSLLVGGPQTVGAIAGHAGLSQPAITQTLAEMKKARLVTAESGPDRRQKIICLTAKGRSLAKRMEPVWNATHRAAAGLERELSARLGDVIDEALAALERRPFHKRIHTRLKSGK